jgi:hypothetical protein
VEAEAGLFHVEARLFHVEAGLFHVEAGLFHVEAGLFHVEAGLFHVEAGVDGRTDISECVSARHLLGLWFSNYKHIQHLPYVRGDT